MSNKIGRFEIVSQLAKSQTATVYKALDTETQQTVALKVVSLDKAKDRAGLLKRVFEESDQSKPLNSHNIAVLYGVGDEGDQLLAATEYVQGNSVATTLARKDGFSIWDLQDIARQICHALDHAQVHHVVHQSLEPAKIMVQWDGLVKVLGFGISTMSAHAVEAPGVPDALHYASPEQVRGQACDHRSTLFSLGVILYEMATEQKAFAGQMPEQVRAAILEATPPLPVRLKANVNPGLSTLIMKAISKSPDERYQSGQELVRDLEQCKAGVNTAVAAPGAAAQKTKAAVAGVAGTGPKPLSKPVPETNPLPKTTASTTPVSQPPAKPTFAVDPMMAEGSGPTGPASSSFSEISELPPLKEVYVTPIAPAAEAPEIFEPLPRVEIKKTQADKSSVQVREAAQKAVAEIRKTPPKLYLSAMAVVIVLIASILAGITIRNYFEDRVPSAADSTIPAVNPAPADSPQTAKTTPPVTPPSAPQRPELAQSEAAQPEAAPPKAEEPAATPAKSSRGQRKTRSRPVPAVLTAQLSVSSNPVGAQIAFDGSPLCQTPCTLTGIAPGQHVVAASKAGYGHESRTVAISSGAKSSLTIDLNQLGAKLLVASTPAGAVILIDGKDSGKLTPAQFSLEKPGTHTVALRRYGYLEETSSINAEAGQTSNVNLVLKPLGSTDEIRSAGGKFKKVFGRGNAPSMGIVSIKTQPKGAQIMVNNRVLDKTAPFDFYLNSGTYVIDITMSGYKSVHRVINVEEQERVSIEEALSPQ
jgi:serine/threonine-protein kinase